MKSFVNSTNSVKASMADVWGAEERGHWLRLEMYVGADK